MLVRPFSVAAASVLTLASWPATAHISLDIGGTHLSRYGDEDIKEGPCGRAGGTRGTNVYTYRPGETITISVVETIRHPGYFRIAFDADGDDDFIDPQTVDPINRACMQDPADKCGASDFYNNEAVLMDNLEPHNPTNPFLAQGYSFDVTLPNVTCTGCTLQLIQVMTDAPGIHAPYNPNEPNADDIYFQCIDLVLEGEPIGGVPDAGAGGVPGAGGQLATGGAPAAGGSLPGTGGGIATGGAAPGGGAPNGSGGVGGALGVGGGAALGGAPMTGTGGSAPPSGGAMPIGTGGGTPAGGVPAMTGADGGEEGGCTVATGGGAGAAPSTRSGSGILWALIVAYAAGRRSRRTRR